MNTTTDIKLSKADLKNPDQVTKTLRKGFVWSTDHSKIVVTLVVLFILLGVGVSISQYLTETKETKLQVKYYPLEKQFGEKRRGFEEAAQAEVNLNQAKTSKNKDLKTPAFDPAKKATGDLQRDFGTVIAGFEALINESPKSTAAQMSALNLSAIYLNYRKNEEALTVLQKVEPGLNHKEYISGLVYLQLGKVLANKNDCNSALSVFQKVLDSKSFQFLHGEAKLQMGLCYESLNDWAKAEELFKDVAKKGTSASGENMAMAQDAEKFLRLLKAQKVFNFNSYGCVGVP